MTTYLIGFILLVGLGYGAVEALPLILGPSLTITSPEQHATIPENGVLEVAGTASRATQLTLDGGAVLYDQDGRFSSTLTFPRGGSILTLIATDRFGRSVKATRTIFVP